MRRGKRTKYSQCSQSRAGTTELQRQKASPGPPGEKASAYRRLTDIPFVPWKVLIRRTRSRRRRRLICGQSFAREVCLLTPALLHKTHISHTRWGGGAFAWPLTMNTAAFNLAFLEVYGGDYSRERSMTERAEAWKEHKECTSDGG